MFMMTFLTGPEPSARSARETRERLATSLVTRQSTVVTAELAKRRAAASSPISSEASRYKTGPRHSRSPPLQPTAVSRQPAAASPMECIATLHLHKRRSESWPDACHSVGPTNDWSGRARPSEPEV